ncbi:Mrp/NBP35 family ATP-binding protein [Syntrophomonas palmitatica]|uniref:Mrp/NBP35 family ATP-binding protein n=1 Tax=Syntrophomonas palmitatica TaxID=402877 RepID=UPI0006D0C56C|nr:Mrp/NBP35 family ATP-binding protein [Syntrophomonas palmitatica]
MMKIDKDVIAENDNKALIGSLNQIDKVIAVMSGKGGVGKSTFTALIAASLARSGYKVGILDADITGPSQARVFGLKPDGLHSTEFGLEPVITRSGIKMISINFLLPNEDDPVIWRGPLLAGAVKQFWEEVDWQDLDYLVVDLPPGTGDVPLTVLQSIPVDGLVIVSSPQDLALMVVKKAIKMAAKMKVPILGLVENMSEVVCSHCGETLKIFGPGQGEKVAAEMNISFLGSLPWDQNLNEHLDTGRVEFYLSSRADQIMENILAQLPQNQQ